MEKQYSVQFFASFVEHLQDVCRNYLNYDQFVEVSGYVCVEIDNMKKERYVLSELLQSSGNVVSESYCTKAFKTQESAWQLSRGNHNMYIEDDGNNQSQYSNKENRNYRTNRSSIQDVYQSPTHLGPPSTSRSHLGSPASRSHLGSPSASRSLSESYGSTPSEVYGRRESYNSGSDLRSAPQSSKTEEVLVTLPETYDMRDSVSSVSASSDADEVIDLDMFEDDEPVISMESETAVSEEIDFGSFSAGSQQRSSKLNKLSPGTLSVVKNSVKQFRRFHFDKSGIDVDLLSTPPEKLNILLMEYFKDARKADGQLLTARTLKNVHGHIDMYLRDGGYSYSLNKDRQFQSSRDYLKKKLNEGGKTIAQKHSPVDEDDVEILFQTNQLGAHSPETLSNTMWFLNSKYFAIRRPAEHLNMKWGDIQLKVSDEGHEYIERPINGTFALKVFAKPEMPNRCFVNFYKQYRGMRPKMYMDEKSPFYLKYDRNQGFDSVLLPEPLTYSAFTCIWRKLVIGSKLPLNKKIF